MEGRFDTGKAWMAGSSPAMTGWGFGGGLARIWFDLGEILGVAGGDVFRVCFGLLGEVPEFFGAAFGAAGFLPELEGAFTDFVIGRGFRVW